MKPNQLTRSQAATLSNIITSNAEIICGLAVIEIAAGIRQDVGIQTIATEAIRAAHKIEKQLDALLRSGGWEIRHTSPLVRTLVEIATPLHDSLEHVGAVGEASMPDDHCLAMARINRKSGLEDQAVAWERASQQQKPVTGGKKPVTVKPRARK